MSFQADWCPGAGLDDSMTWQSQMYYAGLMCDQYGNPQYPPNCAFPYFIPNSTSASFDTVASDTATWNAWPGLMSTSGYPAVQPQVGQAAPADCLQDCDPMPEQADAKQDAADETQDTTDPIKALEQRLGQLEQSFGRLQNEFEQDRARMVREKEMLCTEIESYVAQLQEWASTVRMLVDDVAGATKAT